MGSQGAFGMSQCGPSPVDVPWPDAARRITTPGCLPPRFFRQATFLSRGPKSVAGCASFHRSQLLISPIRSRCACVAFSNAAPHANPKP